MMLVVAPWVMAALEAIQIVECVGDRQTACERFGEPKHGYSSAACARRALLVWSWRHESSITSNDVVYCCTWCGDWHHGRQNKRVGGRLTAEVVPAA